MLRVACAGLWLALCASFALSAGIIGVPVGMILGEILRVTVWLGLAIGAFMLGRAVVHEWRRDDNNPSSNLNRGTLWALIFRVHQGSNAHDSH